MLEDPPLHQQPGQEHDQGHGQGVPEVTELCKLFRIDSGVVDCLWLLHARPGDTWWQPDIIIPEQGGQGGHHGGHHGRDEDSVLLICFLQIFMVVYHITVR